MHHPLCFFYIYHKLRDLNARWLYIVLFFLCNVLQAQPFPDIHFNSLTENEGLSDNGVNCITKDKQGFIWIGTYDGLNRFDGYRIKKFFHNPALKNSLISNLIFRIVPDSKDRLWISTREGVSVYDKQTGEFRNFRHNPGDSLSLDNDQNVNIFPADQNNTWINTQFSLYHVDSSFRFEKVPTGMRILNINENFEQEAYTNLGRGRQGKLWGNNADYVFMIDNATMQIEKKIGPFQGAIQVVYQDSDMRYWVGSFGGGLMSFDPVSGKIVSIKLASASRVIGSISEWWDRYHKRWIVLGSDHGLILVDPVDLRSKEYDFHLGYFPQQILSKNSVQCVYVDRQDILWVCTEAGVSYARPSYQLFDLWNISPSQGILPVTSSDYIYSLTETSNGYWMSRWTGRGLYFFNKAGTLKMTVNTIQTNKGKFSLSDFRKPYYLQSEGDSILWITTNEYLVHYDLRSKKALLYKPPDGYDNTGLRTITVVDEHHWWIRTRNNGSNGIYIFDPVNRIFLKHFTNSPGCKDCIPPRLLTLFITKKREIYATAIDEGLLKYDPASDKFIPVFKFQGEELRQHSNSFESIAEDNYGNLWIGTYTGLVTFSPATKTIIKDYSDNEILGGVVISGIIFDQWQNVWLSTGRGIYYILHSTGQPLQLTNTAGISSNSIGVFTEGSDHSIFLGTQGYVLRINPLELLSQREQSAPVHFSEVTIMDKPSFFHLTSSGKKEITILPEQRRFTLDFSVLNYDAGNRYYYRLEGVMNDWQQNENGHLAFYNLSPGTYTLQVKGGMKSGNKPESEDSVRIIVKPYWWQTIWFKLAGIVLIVFLAALIIRRRFAQVRKEASFRQKIAETEMMALRSQMNPHFIFNSLSSIENFIMKNEKLLASGYLNKFARLIRMILDSSRSDLVPLTKDLEALRLYVDLEQLRFNDKFCFKLDVEPVLSNGDYKVPPLLVQPYVENAIVHGLAHSERKNLFISVAVSLNGESIKYVIRDNGIGRQMAEVYNRQIKPYHKSSGLTITEQRINIFNKEQHASGQVKITDLYDDNKKPAGTEVEIMIKAI